MSLNQIIKERREILFPKKKAPCSCNFGCSRFDSQLPDCDGCKFCGTDEPDLYYSEKDVEHLVKNIQ